MNGKLMLRGGSGLTALMLAPMLHLMACGSDAPPPRPAHLKPFTFEVDWGGPEYIGYYAAQFLGYYDEAGLDVTIKTGGGSAIAAQGLLDGTIPLGTASANAIVRAALEKTGGEPPSDGAALPSVAAVILPENPSVVITRKDINISSAEDFAGLKIGYPSKSAEAFREFESLLQLHPGLESRLTLTEYFLQGGQQFRSGEIDALITYLMDVPADLEADGVPFNVVRLKDLGVDVAGQCIVLAPKAAVDPVQLDAFLRASYDGWEYVRRNPENAAKLYAAKFPQQNPVKLEIIARHCASLLPPPTPGNTAQAYTDRAAIRAALLDSLNLLLETQGARWDDAERDRFVAALLPGEGADPAASAPEDAGSPAPGGY